MPGNLGSLGSLFIDLAANTATFESDIGRAQRVAEKRAREIQKGFQDAAKNIALAFVSVDAAVSVFNAFTRDIPNAIANYKGLSEQIGDTAQAVASLKPVADVSGVALATVAGASVKLTAALSKQNEESGGAAAAIKALGLDFKSFQQLAPVAQIEAVATQFALFEDNAAKTAVAVALFGKSGAELIPFLNDLADRGERQVVLTQQQIEAADEYAKMLDRLSGQVGTLGQQYATALIPTLDSVVRAISEVTDAFLSNAELRPEITAFAEGTALAFATIAESVVGLVRALGAVGGSFQVVLNDIRAVAEFPGFFGSDERKADYAKFLEQRAADLRKAGQRYTDLIEYNGTAISDALRKSFAQQAAAQAGPAAAAAARPGLQFSLAKDGKASKPGEQKFGPMADQQIKDFLATLKQQDQQVKDYLKAAEEQQRQRERIADALARQYGPENAGANYGFGLSRATSGMEIAGITGKAADAENDRYAAELAAFEESRQEIIARGDDYYGLMAEAARAHQDELNRIEQDGNAARAALQRDQVLAAEQSFAMIADAALVFGKKGFAIYKAAAIASTLIGTYDAAQSAAASAAKVPVIGNALAIAAAASQVVLGLARVGQIRSTNIGSRRFGGPVAAGGVYEVAEPGNPELIKYGSKTILAMGSQPGTVMPARVASASAALAGAEGRGGSTEVNIYGGVARTERSRVGRREIVDVFVDEFSDNAGPIRRQLAAATGLRSRGSI